MSFSELDRAARAPLRTLSKDNATQVGRHLVMVARLIDVDPELAYEHAQAAVRRGGRVDVVREAAGLAAYRTGRYAEALRELRTVRRLNGSSEHLPVMADCERGLGRPERAIALAQGDEARTLSASARVELAIVVSGARLDLGELEAAVASLETTEVRAASGLLAVRVAVARAAALEAAGRPDDAARELARFSAAQVAEATGEGLDEDDDVVVYDVEDELAVDEDELAVDEDALAVDEDELAVDEDARDEEPPGAAEHRHPAVEGVGASTADAPAGSVRHAATDGDVELRASSGPESEPDVPGDDDAVAGVADEGREEDE